MMKQYGFARFYLRGLMVCAVISMLAGIAMFGINAIKCIGLLNNASNAKSQKYRINTKAVCDDYDAAYSIVLNMMGISGNKLAEIEPPAANGFPVGSSAELTLAQVISFESYMSEIEISVGKIKETYLSEYERAVRTLLEAARLAAKKNQTTNQATTPDSAENTKNYGQSTFAQLKPTADTLYARDTFKDSELIELESVNEFLSNRIGNYTPQAQALEIGLKAGKNVSNILKLIEKEMQDKKPAIMEEKPIKPEVMHVAETPSEKQILIAEYIKNLEYCLGTVRQTALANWQIDRTMDAIKTQLVADKARIKNSVEQYNSDAMSVSIVAFRTLFFAIVTALLLLIVRDFLSAIIDVALNTGEMNDSLKKLS